MKHLIHVRRRMVVRGRRPILVTAILAGMVGLLFAIVPTVQADDPTFAVRRAFGLGTDDTRSIVVGDMDGDGDLDLVTGNFRQQNVIYLNDGMGGFPMSRSFGAGADGTVSVAVGDLDGDGDLDLVAGNYTKQNAIYLNNGKATFSTARLFGTGPDDTRSVAVGDLDGDGDLDLIVGSTGQNAIYLNNGKATFSTARLFGTGTDNTRSVTVGDMDGDGDLDIVTGNYTEQNVVYLNDGAATFSTARPFGTGTDKTMSVAVGDVDRDGDLDIVTGNHMEQNVVYLNDGAATFSTARLFGTGTDMTHSIAMGDLDGDGDLDLITGNYGQQNVVYLNNGAATFSTARLFGTGTDNTQSVAAGDMDSDSDLDIVTGNNVQQNVVYLNDGGGSYPTSRLFGTGTDRTLSVAVGDMDGDGDLDIVTGNFPEQNVVYLNNGKAVFPTSRLFGTGTDRTLSVAAGDMDGDGDLDIVTGNEGQQSVVYLNNGTPAFTSVRLFGTGTDRTYSVAVGDMDGDGDLDIVAGNSGQNAVYLNDGKATFSTARLFGTGTDMTHSIAVGDLDGDVEVAGNNVQQNVVYLNDGAATFSTARLFGTGTDDTRSVAVGDMDGDGDLDLVTGNGRQQNVVYLNDGAATFSTARLFGTGTGDTRSVAVGDMDGDGDLDLVTGNHWDQPKFTEPNAVYSTGFAGSARLANQLPRIVLGQPGQLPVANYFSSPVLLSSPTISIPFTLYDAEGNPVRFIRAFYSQDGGGHWLPAVSTTGTPVTNLAASPRGTGYVFGWDTFASSFFGQSDNVVFRIEAYPTLHSGPNSVSGPYQQTYVASHTFPFRVRGTQVRVRQRTANGDVPVENALIYRLNAGQVRGALFLADSTGAPLRTNYLGYLRGQGTLREGDRLLALAPQLITSTYTLYYTSAISPTSGIPAYTVHEPGLQPLTASAANPLVLFNLDVSLEWDARQDARFLAQMRYDLLRTSEFLYDWTNGQVALGQVKVYQDKTGWADADVRIYASNRVRPSAAQGGILADIKTEIIHHTDGTTSTISYGPGQVHMGAVWNRFGDTAGSSVSEDWPLTLAHELGHYLLFLDDDYLGLNQDGVLVPVTSCTGTAMADPYREDHSEFHPDDGWLPGCANTLANRLTGRSDWATILTFYPWLKQPKTLGANPGPRSLPIEVTQIEFVDDKTPVTTLAIPIFYLVQNNTSESGRYQPGTSARAILFQGDRLIDLGQPTQDQVLARGARPGDRLCVYELDAARMGCEVISSGDEEVAVTRQEGWQPEITVTPITTRTLSVSVAGDVDLRAGQVLLARVFPANDPATQPFTLRRGTIDGQYVASTTLLTPTLEAYVQVWVDGDMVPRREIITQFALAGNPGFIKPGGGFIKPGGGFIKPGGGFIKPGGAPGGSPDGQVSLFGGDFAPGKFFTLQTATRLPALLPAGTSLIGRSYWLRTAVPNALEGTSISIRYLGKEVPLGQEQWLQIYYFDGTSWSQLRDTQVDKEHNTASVRTRGQGLYVLGASNEIVLYGPGWDLFAYPLQEPQAITEVLTPLLGQYSHVYGYDGADSGDPWKIFAPGVPGLPNDLHELTPSEGYWIRLITATATIRVGGDTSAQLTNSQQEAIPTGQRLGGRQPPATYFGPVLGSSGFTPVAGLPVLATISGHPCGQGRTLHRDGQVIYSVDVFADDPEDAPGCGMAGRWIQFQVGSQAMATRALWDNNKVWQAPLEPLVHLYMPLIARH